jgi:hypothetical protein
LANRLLTPVDELQECGLVEDVAVNRASDDVLGVRPVDLGEIALVGVPGLLKSIPPPARTVLLTSPADRSPTLRVFPAVFRIV